MLLGDPPFERSAFAQSTARQPIALRAARKKRLFVMCITSRAHRIGEAWCRSLRLDGRRFPMRKFDFLAVTALILVGVGGWVVSTTQARNTAPMNGTRIDALQIMTVAKDMPTDHFVDYSLVYEK
jgi:hypothetical protein